MSDDMRTRKPGERPAMHRTSFGLIAGVPRKWLRSLGAGVKRGWRNEKGWREWSVDGLGVPLEPSWHLATSSGVRPEPACLGRLTCLGTRLGTTWTVSE
eukprot:9472247-Pyramimonas_sp.AAC.1